MPKNSAPTSVQESDKKHLSERAGLHVNDFPDFSWIAKLVDSFAKISRAFNLPEQQSRINSSEAEPNKSSSSSSSLAVLNPLQKSLFFTEKILVNSFSDVPIGADKTNKIPLVFVEIKKHLKRIADKINSKSSDPTKQTESLVSSTKNKSNSVEQNKTEPSVVFKAPVAEVSSIRPTEQQKGDDNNGINNASDLVESSISKRVSKYIVSEIKKEHELTDQKSSPVISETKKENKPTEQKKAEPLSISKPTEQKKAEPLSISKPTDQKSSPVISETKKENKPVEQKKAEPLSISKPTESLSISKPTEQKSSPVISNEKKKQSNTSVLVKSLEDQFRPIVSGLNPLISKNLKEARPPQRTTKELQQIAARTLLPFSQHKAANEKVPPPLPWEAKRPVPIAANPNQVSLLENTKNETPLNAKIVGISDEALKQLTGLLSKKAKPASAAKDTNENRTGFFAGLKQLAGVAGLISLIYGLNTSSEFKGISKLAARGLLSISGVTKAAQKVVTNLIDGLIKLPKKMLKNFAKTIGALFGKQAAKTTFKTGLSALKGFIPKMIKGALLAFKKVPFIGSLISVGFAISRFRAGDVVGGGIEVLSGLAQLFGLAPLSWALDGLNAVLDYKAGGATGKQTGAKLDILKGMGKWIGDKMKKLPIIGPLMDAVSLFIAGDWKKGFVRLAQVNPLLEVVAGIVSGGEEGGYVGSVATSVVGKDSWFGKTLKSISEQMADSIISIGKKWWKVAPNWIKFLGEKILPDDIIKQLNDERTETKLDITNNQEKDEALKAKIPKAYSPVLSEKNLETIKNLPNEINEDPEYINTLTKTLNISQKAKEKLLSAESSKISEQELLSRLKKIDELIFDTKILIDNQETLKKRAADSENATNKIQLGLGGITPAALAARVTMNAVAGPAVPANETTEERTEKYKTQFGIKSDKASTAPTRNQTLPVPTASKSEQNNLEAIKKQVISPIRDKGSYGNKAPRREGIYKLLDDTKESEPITFTKRDSAVQETFSEFNSNAKKNSASSLLNKYITNENNSTSNTSEQFKIMIQSSKNSNGELAQGFNKLAESSNQQAKALEDIGRALNENIKIPRVTPIQVNSNESGLGATRTAQTFTEKASPFRREQEQIRGRIFDAA